MFQLPELKPEEIIIYLRKSRTDDPALSVSETLSKHEQMLDDWCDQNLSDRVPEQNRFREVVSGETISARPEMQKVLRLIEQPKYKAILIVEPQRLSRGDLEDIGRLTKILRYTNTIVITRMYSYDLDDERDREFFERELKRGNEFLEYSKKIMMNGRILSAERGNYIGSRRPFGYKRVFKSENGKKYPTLEIIPEEAEVVITVFRMYADGIGATRICAYLNNIGSRPKNGEIWTPPCIYPMLDNPLYIGKIKWGHRKTVKTVENGEISLHAPVNKNCQIFDGKHEPIVSSELWEKVRSRRDSHDIPKVKISSELQNPLSGILFCRCGRMMIRRPYRSRCLDRFQCPSQTYCGTASCTMEEMINEVINILKSSIQDFEVHIKQSGNESSSREKIRLLESRLLELEKKEIALWEKYTEGMPKIVFEELLEKNNRQKSEVAEMISAEESKKEPDYVECVSSFHAAISALQSPTVSASEKNMFLKKCIKKIVYSRERGTREKGGATGGWISKPIQLQVELLI